MRLFWGKTIKLWCIARLNVMCKQPANEKQMEYHPCKSVGIIEYSGFAKTIDERITCECLSCYPILPIIAAVAPGSLL